MCDEWGVVRTVKEMRTMMLMSDGDASMKIQCTRILIYVRI